jgi:hypothetical protein
LVELFTDDHTVCCQQRIEHPKTKQNTQEHTE